MTGAPTRILLADDHRLVRRGVRLILDQEPDFEVVAEASDGAEAVALAASESVDLAILDIAMPRLTGLQATREILARKAAPKVLLLSMYENERYFFDALRLGASGYVLKSAADEDLVRACRAAIRGRAFVYPSAMGALVRDYLNRVERGERLPDTVLTAREDEVLKLVAEGSSTRDIAATLGISGKTVERHRANILAKLGLRDRTQVVRYAIRAGLIEP